MVWLDHVLSLLAVRQTQQGQRMTDLELKRALRAAANVLPDSYLTVPCRQYLAERRWQDSDRSAEIVDERIAREGHGWLIELPTV